MPSHHSPHTKASAKNLPLRCNNGWGTWAQNFAQTLSNFILKESSFSIVLNSLKINLRYPAEIHTCTWASGPTNKILRPEKFLQNIGCRNNSSEITMQGRSGRLETLMSRIKLHQREINLISASQVNYPRLAIFLPWRRASSRDATSENNTKSFPSFLLWKEATLEMNKNHITVESIHRKTHRKGAFEFGKPSSPDR